MKLRMPPKWLAFASALLVGALGSGLWELAKPALVLASSFALDVVTLGLGSLRDGLYEEAARRPPTQVGTLVLFTALIVLFLHSRNDIVQIALHRRLLMRLPRSRGKRSPTEVAIVEDAGQPVPPRPALTPTLAAGISKFEFWGVVIGAPFFALLIVVIMAFVSFRSSYVGRAISHFDQLAVIAAPYMSEAELREVRGTFAQVRTREQYVAVVDRLKDVARRNQQRVPDFTIY